MPLDQILGLSLRIKLTLNALFADWKAAVVYLGSRRAASACPEPTKLGLNKLHKSLFFYFIYIFFSKALLPFSVKSGPLSASNSPRGLKKVIIK